MIKLPEIIQNTVKALSWKPPFGEMMLHGKDETRVWDTTYRGLVLICLSKTGYNLNQLNKMSGSILTDWILAKTIDEDHLNGHAIAIGRLVSTRKMTEDDESTTYVKYKGVWTEERTSKITGKTKVVEMCQWVHKYEDVRRIVPFKWEGSLGWKTLTQEHKSLIVLR